MADDIRIPDWIADLETFRRWARSEEYPRHGWFSFLDGDIWVDTSMEKLFSHNRVKTQFTVVLGALVESASLGYFFPDRALLSNPPASVSTEPDGTFVSFASLKAGQARLVEGATDDFIELEGAPDMVLEVVSDHSVRKDTRVLRELYWRAGIAEYWLVDARADPVKFDILRRAARGYVATRRQEGWLRSNVFQREFTLRQEKDALGHPRYFFTKISRYKNA